MKKQLSIPVFKSEQEEAAWWREVDLSKYFEPSDFEPVLFPDLKPTTRAISIRLPEYLVARVKEKANELSMPYQALIKQYIKRGVLSDK